MYLSLATGHRHKVQVFKQAASNLLVVFSKYFLSLPASILHVSERLCDVKITLRKFKI